MRLTVYRPMLIRQYGRGKYLVTHLFIGDHYDRDSWWWVRMYTLRRPIPDGILYIYKQLNEEGMPRPIVGTEASRWFVINDFIQASVTREDIISIIVSYCSGLDAQIDCVRIIIKHSRWTRFGILERTLTLEIHKTLLRPCTWLLGHLSILQLKTTFRLHSLILSPLVWADRWYRMS